MGNKVKQFSLKNYLHDKVTELIVFAVLLVVIAIFFRAFGLKIEAIIMIIALILMAIIGLGLYEYFRKEQYYEQLQSNLIKLDQAYLITEMLEQPNFLEGEILYDVCYELDKSMLEKISDLEQSSRDFQEYIELWLHEIKSPLVALNLLAEKNASPEFGRELGRVNDLAEQVLYFVRAESSAKDYLLGSCELSEIVKAVLLDCRTQIQLQQVEIITGNLTGTIHSDAKWLKFMVGQVLVNALKYGATKISFELEHEAKDSILKIRDNGIGIAPEDLPRVFDKTFTGQNGHGKTGARSTGMGLYLVKTLTDKLGHKVEIDSKTGDDSFTEVKFYFGEHDYYKNVC